jgi:hypothetical protein
MDLLLLGQHLELEGRRWWFVARSRILLGVLERNLDQNRGLHILEDPISWTLV